MTNEKIIEIGWTRAFLARSSSWREKEGYTYSIVVGRSRNDNGESVFENIDVVAVLRGHPDRLAAAGLATPQLRYHTVRA